MLPSLPAATGSGEATGLRVVFRETPPLGGSRFRRLYEVPVMVPWLNALMEENGRLLGPDWWPYGISVNRTAVDTYLRYHYEQGLSARRWTVEEIFDPHLLDT